MIKPKRKVSEHFRPQMLFTLDQIAYILRIPVENVYDYVWTPGSKTPPGRRMQAVKIVDYMNRKDFRVSESQLDEWAERVGFTAINHFI